MMLIYDLDSPNEDRNKYCIFLEAIGYNIIIQGIFQPIFAVIVAALICPLVAASVLLGKLQQLKLNDLFNNSYLSF